MKKIQHHFSVYELDPLPDTLWRDTKKIEGMKLGFCESCGFYHVDPYPSESYLSEFYKSYGTIQNADFGGVARLIVRNVSKDSKIIDFGCGKGGLLSELYKLGYRNLYGFDQSPEVDDAKKLGIGSFDKIGLWDYLDDVESEGGTDADLIVMINVLEHVSRPIELLQRVYDILPTHGKLCVVTPNDFSALQRAKLKLEQCHPWFVCVPDHLNYFNFHSLKDTLSRNGFEVIDYSANYPFELFLLQDLDYVSDPDLGPIANGRRVTFEENMYSAQMADVLDHFYRTLASGGYGRSVMYIAKKNDAQD